MITDQGIKAAKERAAALGISPELLDGKPTYSTVAAAHGIVKPLDLNSKYNQPMPEFRSGSNTTIDVLPWLWNQPWNELALAYVSALRPSCIRFSRGEVFCDARSWRVTVTLDSHDLIVGIQQEVQVGLPDGIPHGAALDDALYRQIRGKQDAG